MLLLCGKRPPSIRPGVGNGPVPRGRAHNRGGDLLSFQKHIPKVKIHICAAANNGEGVALRARAVAAGKAAGDNAQRLHRRGGRQLRIGLRLQHIVARVYVVKEVVSVSVRHGLVYRLAVLQQRYGDTGDAGLVAVHKAVAVLVQPGDIAHLGGLDVEDVL